MRCGVQSWLKCLLEYNYAILVYNSHDATTLLPPVDPRPPPMVIGTATVTLQVHEAASLKDKRSVVKRVIARTRAKFNVAIAEVDTHDAWSTITLGLACVSTEAGHAHAMLEKAVHWIAEQRLDADLVDYDIELV